MDTIGKTGITFATFQSHYTNMVWNRIKKKILIEYQWQLDTVHFLSAKFCLQFNLNTSPVEKCSDERLCKLLFVNGEH